MPDPKLEDLGAAGDGARIVGAIPHRRGALAASAFGAVCVACAPVMAVGYLWWIATLYRGRSSGLSATAQGPLSARWVQHRLGTRPDEAAERLLMALPNVSSIAVWLLFGPLLLAHRVSGYVPATFRYPFVGRTTIRNQAAARQTFYDRVVDQRFANDAQRSWPEAVQVEELRLGVLGELAQPGDADPSERIRRGGADPR
jgi:hypothetical protein